MFTRVLERTRLTLKFLTRMKMDLTEMLEIDHMVIDLSYLLFKMTKDPREAAEIVEFMVRQLTRHSEVEEELFYPACQEISSLRDRIREGYEEHRQIKKHLGELRNAGDLPYEKLKAQVESLMAVVRHHVGEEEREVLPVARKSLQKSKMQELISQVVESKQRRLEKLAA